MRAPNSAATVEKHPGVNGAAARQRESGIVRHLLTAKKWLNQMHRYLQLSHELLRYQVWQSEWGSIGMNVSAL